MSFSSCDEVDELTQIDFDTDITEEITVNLSDASDSFTGNVMINLADNSDIEEYLSNIEDIQITEASYILKNYVGEEIATGSITATAASQSFGPYSHTFFTDAQNGTVFEFDDAAKLNTVANTLQNTNQLNVQFSGTQDPAQNGSFIIEVTFKLNVTAQAL